MTPFQDSVKTKLNEISRNHKASIIFSDYDCEANDLIGHEFGDVYIETSIKKSSLKIMVYIYTDEANVKIENHDILFELPDYKNDSNLLGKVLLDFVQIALNGEVPKKALIVSRSKNGLPS
ncbi:MAG: hypothetical protein KKF30_08780 [Proteobacteria bacterium]|nr:hypothetical protein [Pseudomonadota bacterium]MBU4469337.1 hypothetical protein [Pseudomonadota bacterium]MCG2753553.1 hypothetical protein [Desulfobacteraceae bacterium]